MRRAIERGAALRRARALKEIRRKLDDGGFCEITTPVMLEIVEGSPKARNPFLAGTRSFDLRNSIELLLRTALASLPRVYDIGPAIRLEDYGTKSTRAVEFTLLELYVAESTYEALIDLSLSVIAAASDVPLNEPTRINVCDWFRDALGIDFARNNDQIIASKLSEILGKVATAEPLWPLINDVIEAELEPTLKGFTLLHDYPTDTVCLARRAPGQPHKVERFEIYIDQIEIGHGFVDETDPEDVQDRMLRNGPEFVDLGFVEKLRKGLLPRSGGFGLGIERLLAATDDVSRDVRRYIHEYQHS